MDYKALTDEQLTEVFAGVAFKTPPKRHQLATLAWCFDKDRVAYWHGIGTGKTLCSLYAHDLWGTRKHLVVCPNSVVGSWDQQARLHTDQRPILLRGDREERRAILAQGGPGLYVVNYEGLLVLFCEPEDYEDKDGHAHVRHKVDKDLCRAAGVDGLTADECHALANGTATQTKVFRELSRTADHVVIMTGTPISTSEQNLWSEYWCLDGGRTLGDNRWWFLKRHFKQDFWGNWVIRPGERERLLGRVAPVTLRYSREECVDLPPRTYETRTVPMSEEQRRAYQAITTGQEFTVQGQTVKVDPASAAQKLSQVAGGFILDGLDALRLAANPKLDEVARTLDEVDGKIILFHAYVEEGRMLEALCKKKGLSFASIRGEVADKTGAIERFTQDPACRVLIAQPRSGGVGLNLQCASVAGFYSNGLTGAVCRDQAEGRIYRTGQDRPCLFIDWEVEGSLDGRHLHRIAGQAELLQSALDFVKNYRP